ncbi:MAG TPA: hypothetical protein PLV92_22915, partial [Pirellulaceae bacterium]|nr:hypothetical protein [Pirellulaceae bacterium]
PALVLDAETPLRRVEQEVYRELRRRRMPTIVVVSRMQLVAPGDRAELEEYLTGRLPDARQVPLAYFPDDSGGAGEVEAALEGLLTEVRPPELRARMTALQLAATIDDLLALALAAEERQTRSESERAALARDRREKFERVDLVWHDVQLNLHRRRQRVEAPVREHLAAHRQTLLESLLYDLERTSDVKSWWERDLPFKLQREFRTLASQLSGMVNRQIETDTQWARDELQRRLEQSLPTAAARTTKLDADQPSLEQQPLANTETWKVASRLSTGAAVIAAATLFATAGVGGIAMAASIGVGVLAEQLLRMRTQRDRDKVRAALGDAVAQAELNYTVEVSHSLGAGYDALLEHLKSQQIRWQQAQLRALQELSARPADADLTAAAGAVDELRRLHRELQQALDA